MANTTPVGTDPQPVAVFDVRASRHEDVLCRVERALDVQLQRSSVLYGEHGATEGFRTTNGTWVRVERR